MTSRTARLLCLIALTTQTACPLLRGGHATTPSSQGAVGAVRNYTDSDVVTGVAATPTEVFVATLRGVMRYPLAGGNGTRLTTREGLPDNQVFAISSSSDGTVWAATARGVVRWAGDHWTTVGPAQPDVGRPTALLALEGGNVLLGGAQGLARFDGTAWYLLSDRYQVTGFALDQGRPLVATAQSGVLAVRGDYTAVDEYGTASGIPETLVRNVVPTGGGRMWALVQGTNGSKLVYWDGHRWYGYTHEQVRSPWMALVPSRGGAALVVQGGLYDITSDRGEELIPTDAASAEGARRVELTPVRLEPPPPPSPPPPPPPPPTQGRGRGRPARPGRAQHALPDAPGGDKGWTHDDAARGAQASRADAGTASDAGTRAATTASADAGARATTASEASDAGARGATTPVASVDAGARPVAVADAGTRGTTAAMDAGVRVVVGTGADAGATAIATAGDGGAVTAVASADGGAPRPAERTPPPPRPRNIPAYAGPVDVPRGGPTLEAPRFGLVRNERVNLPEDLASMFAASDGLYAARIGLGVTRVAGGPQTDYRSHDLALSRRPLSLATDPDNHVWLVTEDGGAVMYDDRRFSRVTLDPEGTAVPLMFWSRGTRAVAVGRVGNNVVRTYRFAGNGWRQITERPIDTRGPGVLDVKFLAEDERGRVWLGVRVENEGRAREMGVAVIDENLPAATQFHSQVAPTGAEQGAKPAPDDLTAIEFDSNGTAWFAGLSGATSITLPPGGEASVRTYGEANGLRGDLVSDLARGPNDRIYIATPDGLGYWDGQRWAFDIVGSSAVPRVIALAVDINGALWGAGPRGAWRYNGSVFRAVGVGDGLPREDFVDVAVDGENRVWFVTSEGISILSQPRS
jgi:hypothetical protein